MDRKRQQLAKSYLFLLLGAALLLLILLALFGLTNPPPTSTTTEPRFYRATPLPTSTKVWLRPTDLPSPTWMPTGSSTPELPSSTPLPPTASPDADGNTVHIVSSGETLQSIAALYQVAVDELRQNNWMHGNALIPGQRLLINPGSGWLPEYAWYSRLKGDLIGEMIPAYPLSFKGDRFTLHFIPRTYPAVDPQAVAFLFETGLANVEQLFGRPFTLQFDIFAAGKFFEIPNQYLRGHNFGKDLYLVFLHDGSGDEVDQQYLAAHEITHFYMWNTFGQPFSYLLSEGAAVYAGKQAIQGADDIPLQVFCKAYETAGRLPQVSDKELTYRGQNNDLENYYAAGCFVQYLVETYGAEKLGQVYPTGQYEEVYGKTLVTLESEWQQELHAASIPLPFAPAELIDTVAQVKSAYQHFFEYTFTSPDYLPAYIVLDQARLAMINGQFEEAADDLEQYYTLAGKE